MGILNHLRAGDIVFSNHRCHGHFLTYADRPDLLMAELMGRDGGVVSGRGGSQHLCPIVAYYMCLPTIDHASYDFGDKAIDWGKVLQGDRFYALLQIRRAARRTRTRRTRTGRAGARLPPAPPDRAEEQVLMSQTLSTQLAERVRQHSDEALVLALEAFREGRRAEAVRLGGELTAYLEQLHRELEAAYDGAMSEAEAVARLEDGYASALPSPVFAAHFGGAGDVLGRVRSRLEQLISKGAG